MTASKDYAITGILKLRYNKACSLFVMTSDEIPGLLLAGKDPNKLLDDVPAVVKAMFRVAYDMDMNVVIVPHSHDESTSAFLPIPHGSLVRVAPHAS